MSTTKPSDEEKLPEIIIGGFKCINQQGQANVADPGGPTGYVPPNNPLGFDFRRPEAYERMAADKPGEELAHDATIWKLYLEEAAEHDQELVEGRHKSLDMLLLFAALFSAILTAFLIESKNMLQADPQDTLAAFLFQIAQSQLRMELGLPAPADSQSVLATPGFTPTPSARWINGLWFTSLGLSLSAALIAMLSKEWLTAFLTSRPRPAHAHALLRQSRLEGLERWWALHIIALLPSLLHISLLIFSVGLVIYLWTLDIAIAAVLGAIVGGTTIFYIITAVLGAVYNYCPFVTEISGYVRKATVAIFARNQVQQDQSSRQPSQQDLQALLWLANNARDPAVVDCSYQSLAGLQGPSRRNWSSYIGPSHPGSDPVELKTTDIPMKITSDTTIVSLLKTVLDRFNQLSADSFYLASVPDMSISRYINAILALSTHVLSGDYKLSDQAEQNTTEDSRQIVMIEIDDMPTSPLQLLSLTDILWNDGTRPLTASTYANILVSEHGLMQLAALYLLKSYGVADGTGKASPDAVSIKGYALANSNGQLIDTSVTGLSTIPDEEIHHIRAVYSRWLARVSGILRFHSEDKVTVGALYLENLLAAIDLAAQIEILNPFNSTSTHNAQTNNIGDGKYRFTVPFNGDSSFTLGPNDLNVGPLASLIQLLSERPGIKKGSSVEICLPILTAYSHLAPVILQQVLGLPSRDELVAAFKIHSWPRTPESDMHGIRFICTRLMFLTVRYLGSSETKSTSHMNFCEMALDMIDKCLAEDAEHDWSEIDSYGALRAHADDLTPLLEFVEKDESIVGLLSPNARWDLVELGSLFHNENTNLHILTPKCFPALLSMVPGSGVDSGTVTNLFEGIMKCIQDQTQRLPSVPWNDVQPIDYLHQFTCASKGFRSLASLGSDKDFIEPTFYFAVDLTRISVGEDELTGKIQVRLDALAVPGFLQVINLVVGYCTAKREEKAKLIQFARYALMLMRVACAEDNSRKLITEDNTCEALWDALSAVQDEESTGELVSELRSFASELEIELTEAKPADEADNHSEGETEEESEAEEEPDTKVEEGKDNESGSNREKPVGRDANVEGPADTISDTEK